MSLAPVEPRESGTRGALALARWLGAHADAVQAWLDADGAVLLRGHGALDAAELAAVLDALPLTRRTYGEGLARRTELAPGVYSATTVDPASPLALHAELAHTRSPPDLLAFACLRPADEGGETLLADGLSVPAALGASRWAAWRERRLAYLTCRPARSDPFSLGRAWTDVYGTEDRLLVEAKLRAEGATWAWGEAGELRMRLTGPVAALHGPTGAELWYNHLLLWHASALGARGRQLRKLLPDDALPHQATWEDGSAIPDAWVDEARVAVESLARPVPWERGDLLLVDNRRMLHGRRAWRGERHLMVSLCDRA